MATHLNLPPPFDAESSAVEFVDLAAVDLDFAGEDQRHTDGASVRAGGGVVRTIASATDLARVDLFRGVADADRIAFAAETHVIGAAPGCVLQATGQPNEHILFVIEGELRMYGDPCEKRARGIVDAGQSVGLTWALLHRPMEVSVVATEPTRVLQLSLNQLDDFARRSHTFACNVNALYAAYLRGDNCLNVGARALAALHQRRGYTDELTQLHNQHWLATMLPRLLGRSGFDSAPLTLAMFAIDRLDAVEHEFGSIAGEQMLAAVGQLLLAVARPTDLLVCDDRRRFLAILPNTPLAGGRHFCERVHHEAHMLRVGASEDSPLPALSLSCATVQAEGNIAADTVLAQLAAVLEPARPG